MLFSVLCWGFGLEISCPAQEPFGWELHLLGVSLSLPRHTHEPPSGAVAELQLSMGCQSESCQQPKIPSHSVPGTAAGLLKGAVPPPESVGTLGFLSQQLGMGVSLVSEGPFLASCSTSRSPLIQK